MAKKKTSDPNKAAPNKVAREEAEKDIAGDPEFNDSDPTDDLDESELAQRDNSDEDAFDALEKKRSAPNHPATPNHPAAPHHPGKQHPGK